MSSIIINAISINKSLRSLEKKKRTKGDVRINIMGLGEKKVYFKSYFGNVLGLFQA